MELTEEEEYIRMRIKKLKNIINTSVAINRNFIKSLIFAIFFWGSISNLKCQIYTNITVNEMKLRMKQNLPTYKLTNSKGSKIENGSDSLVLYEYWDNDTVNTSNTIYLFYAKNGLIVKCAISKDIKYLSKDIFFFDALLKNRDTVILNPAIISWTVPSSSLYEKKFTIGIVISEDCSFTIIEIIHDY